MKHAAGFNGPDGCKDERGKKLRPWLQDYIRHSAISMYLAKHQHEGEAGTWAGNSPNVIHRHYKGLVKEADAMKPASPIQRRKCHEDSPAGKA